MTEKRRYREAPFGGPRANFRDNEVRLTKARYIVVAVNSDGRIVAFAPRGSGAPGSTYHAAKKRADLMTTRQPHDPEGRVVYTVCPVTEPPPLNALKAMERHPNSFASAEEAKGETGHEAPH